MTGGDVGRCVAEFVVRPENLNQAGGLHGGFTATAVDVLTTYALVTKDCKPGVTVDLHVRYDKLAYVSCAMTFAFFFVICNFNFCKYICISVI